MKGEGKYTRKKWSETSKKGDEKKTKILETARRNKTVRILKREGTQTERRVEEGKKMKAKVAEDKINRGVRRKDTKQKDNDICRQ